MAGGKQFRAMRAIFPMYDTPFQLHGAARVGSPLDGRARRQARRHRAERRHHRHLHAGLLKALKIDAALHSRRAGRSWRRQIEARALDALAVGAGVPFPEFAGLEKRHKVRYLPLTAREVVALRLAIPELGASVVPAGSYPSLTRHYQTVGLYNFAVARSSLPDDLVYAIAEAVFSGHDELMQASHAAAETVPANFTRNTLLPFHPGAMRWYANKATAGMLYGD